MTVHVFDFTHSKYPHLPFSLSFWIHSIEYKHCGSVENLSFLPCFPCQLLFAVYVANSGEQVVEDLMLNTAM